MPRPSLDWLNNEVLSKRGYAVAGGVPVKASHPIVAPVVESDPRSASLGKGKAKKGATRKFLVRVKDYRHRLLDEDNLCEKYVVDCCRYAGLLPGDSPGEAKIEVSQEKIGREESPRVEIEIDIVPSNDRE